MIAHTAAGRLGIAITTFNREAVLAEQLDRLARLTSVPFDLVVSDDGSTDGTVALLRSRGIAHVAGPNRGIAWNKNRGLFHLLHRTGADTILLLDDDVVPTLHGWEQEWIAATSRFGHVNYVPPYLRDGLLTGEARAERPGITATVGGQCLGVARRALATVGFFDPRFGQYGHEHADFSFRLVRAGFGGFRRPYGNGQTFLLAIEGGLALRDVPSHSDGECLARNLHLLFEIAGEPIHRLPWRNEAEMRDFAAEFAWTAPAEDPLLAVPADFDPERYLLANPDVAQSGHEPFLHFVSHGRNEGRSLD